MASLMHWLTPKPWPNNTEYTYTSTIAHHLKAKLSLTKSENKLKFNKGIAHSSYAKILIPEIVLSLNYTETHGRMHSHAQAHTDTLVKSDNVMEG